MIDAIPLLAFSAMPGEAPPMDPILGLFLGIFLVFFNGFFVAAEFALVKVRPTQVDPHVAAGKRRAKMARHMIRHLDSYLSATQLGITLGSLALGWVGEPAFAWLLEPVVEPVLTPVLHLIPSLDAESTVRFANVAVIFLLITVLHIVLGELVPKSMAIRKPEGTALNVSLPLYAFFIVTYPAIWLLNHMANAVLRLVGIQPVAESDMGHDEAELRLLLASAHASALPKAKRELLDNVFELSVRNARQVMVPRADVAYLSTERGMEENLKLARESGHTRFPLCRGGLDEVVGMIHIKDLFRTEPPPEKLEEIARKIAMVPETLTLDRVLKRMRTERLHFAAVLDEYGGISGIVTLENVIEEIVGEIQDEFDAEVPEVVPLSEDLYMVSGSILVLDLEEKLGVEFSDRDEDTLGGVVLSEIGHSPEQGDEVELGPLSIEVVEVQQNRAKMLKVRVQREEAGEDESPAINQPG